VFVAAPLSAKFSGFEGLTFGMGDPLITSHTFAGRLKFMSTHSLALSVEWRNGFSGRIEFGRGSTSCLSLTSRSDEFASKLFCTSFRKSHESVPINKLQNFNEIYMYLFFLTVSYYPNLNFIGRNF
jgi:hypothetical protein